MNILYYDKSTPTYDLYQLWESMRPLFPEGDLLLLPNNVQLLADVSAEELFNVGDKIAVALEKIKEERPEEYKEAYNNRMIIIRDKQWKEAINKANKKKEKVVCDDCTAKSWCDDKERGHKTKCVWHSTNPGGI